MWITWHYRPPGHDFGPRLAYQISYEPYAPPPSDESSDDSDEEAYPPRRAQTPRRLRDETLLLRSLLSVSRAESPDFARLYVPRLKSERLWENENRSLLTEDWWSQSEINRMVTDLATFRTLAETCTKLFCSEKGYIIVDRVEQQYQHPRGRHYHRMQFTICKVGTVLDLVSKTLAGIVPHPPGGAHGGARARKRRGRGGSAAAAGRSAAAARLNELLKPRLVEMARRRNVRGFSTLRKAGLVRALAR